MSAYSREVLIWFTLSRVGAFLFRCFFNNTCASSSLYLFNKDFFVKKVTFAWAYTLLLINTLCTMAHKIIVKTSKNNYIQAYKYYSRGAYLRAYSQNSVIKKCIFITRFKTMLAKRGRVLIFFLHFFLQRMQHDVLCATLTTFNLACSAIKIRM